MIQAEVAIYFYQAMEQGDFTPTLDPLTFSLLMMLLAPRNISSSGRRISKKGLSNECEAEGTLFCPDRSQTISVHSIYHSRVIERDPGFIPHQSTAE
jgi:hypothetical protein